MDSLDNEIIESILEEPESQSEKPIIEVIKEHQEFLLKHFQVKTLTEFLRSKFKYKIEQAYFSWPEVNTPEDTKSYLTMYSIWLLIRIDQIKDDIKTLATPDSNIFDSIYTLGMYRNELKKTSGNLKISMPEWIGYTE